MLVVVSHSELELLLREYDELYAHREARRGAQAQDRGRHRVHRVHVQAGAGGAAGVFVRRSAAFTHSSLRAVYCLIVYHCALLIRV